VNGHLSILFEDHHCLALAKPAGQFAQGKWAPAGETTLETAVRAYLDPPAPDSVYLGIVHRLDRPTSGVLVWAKTLKAARRLSSQFRERSVVKEYWAIVGLTQATAASRPLISPEPAKCPSGENAIWTDWLLRADSNGVASAVDAGTAGAREAVTSVIVASPVSVPPGCAWLQLWPRTGRTHQLRLQAARRGMPILGDATYGSPLPFPEPHGIALHARSLRFRHPTTGVELAIEAPLPSSWAAAGIVLPDYT
jgi:23S rRNA pseudouridine1911/1915/1917 synthase